MTTTKVNLGRVFSFDPAAAAEMAARAALSAELNERAAKERMAKTGLPPLFTQPAATWDELHQKENPDAEWFSNFCARVMPCCAREWMAYVIAHPPPVEEGWFAWTVAAHNSVNARIDKPQISEAAARARWLK